MKFLRGQATRPSCFATYDNASSVAIAESPFQIGLGSAHTEAAALHSCLVRTGYERPCRCHGPDQRDEVATPHSITSSARSRMDEGTSRPSTFAVLRLTTRSKLIGAWTGSSLGFAPLRMRSA